MDENKIFGEIADYVYHENGILYSYSKSVLRTVENIGNNVKLVKKITGNKKSPTPYFPNKFACSKQKDQRILCAKTS